MTAGKAGARSVTISTGSLCASSAVVKNLRAARMSRFVET
jgi:hypothetical protein